jgi:multiple sugar transport system substrate-binding protein
LIIDHPWVGRAAATGAVLPLNEHLPAGYLEDQLQQTVGASHRSYEYNGNQWALAIDAATPAASFRADLFEASGEAIPTTWDELVQLARKGKVAIPAIPIDILMNFYMFCIAHGSEPFCIPTEVIDQDTGLAALDSMRMLYALLDKKMFGYNPIAVAEAMTRTDDYWYCPFAYCYSNYSRIGYADKLLTYDDLVYFQPGQRMRSTIGGTGIAVSASTRYPAEAVQFAREIVSARTQSTFYVQHGGQPGHKAAWTNPEANALCNDFFRRVLPVMENGYMRPRYDGYLHFQDMAGTPLQQYLLHGGNPLGTLQQLNTLYRDSLPSPIKSYHE